MAVDLSWSDPTAAQASAGLALVTGDTLTQTSWQKTVSNLYVLGGGNQEAGRLIYSSATAIIFRAVNGAWVRIAGLLYNLTADITATNTSASIDGTTGQTLATSTLYYVYLYLNGSTVTIDFSTTAYAISTTTGNYGTYIKSGANTRTLIGMIRTNASSQFVDSITQRFVRSWFNDRGADGSVIRTAGNVSTTSTSLVDLTGALIEVLTWSGESIDIGFGSDSWHSATVGELDFNILLDAALQLGTTGFVFHGHKDANINVNTSFTHKITGPSEGYHALKIQWKTNTGTANINGDSTSPYTYHVSVRP